LIHSVITCHLQFEVLAMSSPTKSILFVLLIIAAFTSPVAGQILTNGSFEVPVVAVSDPFYAGNPAITGWTIGGNSVDVGSDAFFHLVPLDPSNHCFDGRQAIDLDGSPGPGSISQSFVTTPGARYQLSFAYSRNIYFPEMYAHDPSLALVTVTGTGLLLSQSLSSNLTGPLLIWNPVSYQFTADSTSATLTFASNDGAGYYGGIYVDDAVVQFASVPELSVLVLGGAGLAPVVFLISRRKRSRKKRVETKIQLAGDQGEALAPITSP